MNESVFELPSAKVRRRNRPLFAVTLAMALLGLVTLGVAALHPALLVLGVLLWNLGAWASLFVWGRNPLARTRVDKVEGSAEGLRVGADLLVPRARIARAYVQPRPNGGADVRFFGATSLDETDVEVPSVAMGRALLSAMALDPSHALVKFRCVSLLMRNLGTQIAAFVLFALVAQLTAGHSPALMMCVVMAIALLALLPRIVLVGADGVRTWWLGIGRFVPYKDIARVGTDDDGVILHLADGKRMHLRTVWPNRGGQLINSVFKPQTAALAERIDQGRIAHGFNADDASAAAFLRPDAAPHGAWIQQMRALGTGAVASFRSADVPEEKLWRMVENPALDDVARAGAAVALSGGDESRKRRLRVAAEATASPRVRVALEAAADGDDDGIAAAVEALRAESAKKS